MSVSCHEVFTFSPDILSDEKFYVAGFEGTEALNALFHFEITLLCANANIDIKSLEGTGAKFTIRREVGDDAVFKGYISKITQGARFNGYTYYTVHLSPSFEKYRLIVNNMIFLNNDLKQTIEKVIACDPFFHLKYEFRFADSYPVKEFAMQYNEKAFDYILWRLEEQGAYFYFDTDGERVIFADNPKSHERSQGTIFYSPTTGLEISVMDEVINSFKLTEKMLPTKVIVRNYDWKDPNNIIVGKAEVSQNGFGDVYLTNEKTANKEEANRIARIRAEQLLSESRIFTGSGSVPFFSPGVVFTLARHFSDALNRDYLITKVKHEGRQETFLNLVAGIPIANAQEHLFYRNTFECIESGTIYRSSKTVMRPRIPGVIHAFIDGDKEGEPVLDKYGRYKVWFPFDLSGRSDGKASCWIRRLQEQVGKDFGVSLPLIPGTEVLITFVNGDPDQPIINRALANGETGSISGGGNKNLSGIRALGGPQLTFCNKPNVIQLTNATGSEITMGAGSLDYMRENTHIGLKSTSVATSETSGAIADNMSSFISRRRAVCQSLSQYLSVLLGAAAKTGQYAYDSLSSKGADPNEPRLDFSAMATKVISMIPFVKAPPYNIRLSASKNNASSRLQCFPTTKELTVNIALMLGARVLSGGFDVADYLVAKKKGNYSDSEKKKMRRKKIIGQMSGFLPELGALIAVAMMAGKLKTKNIGGIMIDSSDKNINLHAKTYISAQAERGIFLNTLKARYDQAGKNDDIGDWGSPTHPLNPVRNAAEAKDPILSIFSKINSVEGWEKKRIDQLLKETHDNKMSGDSWGNSVVTLDGLDEKDKADFIVGRTHMYYMHSDYSYELAASRWLSFSNSYLMALKRNDGTKGFDYSLKIDDKGIFFTNQARIDLSLDLHEQEESDISRASVLLQAGNMGLFPKFDCGVWDKQNQRSSGLDIRDNIVTLEYKSNGNTSSLIMGTKKNEGEIRLVVDKEKTYLSLTKDNASLQAEDINIAAAIFHDTTILGSVEGPLELGTGSELKILSEKAEFENNAEEKIEEAKNSLETLLLKKLNKHLSQRGELVRVMMESKGAWPHNPFDPKDLQKKPNENLRNNLQVQPNQEVDNVYGNVSLEESFDEASYGGGSVEESVDEASDDGGSVYSEI